jgi:pimeloyl-ACP methyl ester carboxylesterase
VAFDSTTGSRDGWELREAGPGEAERTVLLLPGALCTAAFYDDLLADPRWPESGVRLVAATPPGFGGIPLPPGFDPSVEAYAQLVGGFAADLGCDAVVGHSYFGNVAIEMAASGAFAGRLVLLSPCFSTEDEEKDFRRLARVSPVPVVGRLAWVVVRLTMSSSMKGRLPPERHDELVAEMKRSSPAVFRRLLPRYLDHMDRYGSLVGRLCDAGVNAWVVRGDGDEVGLADVERDALERCPTVALVTVPDAAHMVMTDQPARIAELILEVALRR